ncbi:MAG: hypothetical protein KDB90_13415 [Planctomycetes bacterium]|nr:hypothetical protein [Planctomycetota bacterium]
MEAELFQCQVHDPEHRPPFYQWYYAYGTRIGEALDSIRAAVKSNGLVRPILCEADPIDISEVDGDVAPSVEANVFWSVTKYSYSPEPGEHFEMPLGVILSDSRDRPDDDPDPDDIRAGYARFENEGIYSLEVNVSNESLYEHYAALLRLYEPFRVFWFLVHDHWENEGAEADEFFTNEELNTADEILAYISRAPVDSLQNGFVTLTAYASEDQVNVNISDHKKLVVLSTSDSRTSKAAKVLDSLGYEQLSPFVSVDARVHHWHYRPANSRTREQLINRLSEDGFSSWTPDSRKASR